jgi:hypothetical protein
MLRFVVCLFILLCVGFFLYQAKGYFIVDGFRDYFMTFAFATISLSSLAHS